MNPIAFNLFGIDVRWYGILISLGMIIGILLTSYTCNIRQLSYDSMMDIILISLPAAIVGARAYYVLFNLPYYSANPSEIINIRQGGLAIHGGVIFALIAAYIYTRKKKLSLLSYADAAAPSLILAQAIGRWGNFFNQEAHGGQVSYQFISHFPKFIQKGMYIEGAYYHPTFLYESLWNILVFIVLIVIIKRTSKKGIVFFTYVGLYSLGRFVIEGLRTDSLMLGPIRVAQLVSLSGIIVCLIYFYFIYYRKK
ncbi:prolipoprotein diacylglyceryl transferase [Clostridium sp. YIM B02515]|uniref:Phosphatidylglycerol--prolipoprotein diacylglyceryl transferase n=1 Tax=Clostridium rhizosphaerae TaxID=2803861 RepID=A0ABS1T7Q5_9CLOT|nr:prolipoprotein diacylglyceryl transferase [Clostridium rhizosphaerae]MBL4935372.1 prolipoprotein diacylglyceryl transferase [Clostridium rhizosphaerae]